MNKKELFNERQMTYGDLVNYLKDFNIEIGNECVDTMQLARKFYPELSHHRLSDLAEYLNLTSNEHRALADCVTTHELYESIKAGIVDSK